jgi:hypothetical protein
MFKKKTYTIEITYSDNTSTTYKGTSNVSLDSGVLRFTKVNIHYFCNWNMIYGYAIKEE